MHLDLSAISPQKLSCQYFFLFGELYFFLFGKNTFPFNKLKHIYNQLKENYWQESLSKNKGSEASKDPDSTDDYGGPEETRSDLKTQSLSQELKNIRSVSGTDSLSLHLLHSSVCYD